jgi:ubiquinone/menaquinone biosynthesis C-methylase UbiE
VRVWLAVVCLLAVAACGHRDASGEPPPAGPTDDLAREQVKFDAERAPDKVVAALGIGPGSRVADIGAGSGLLTVHLARAVAPNGKVVATDIDGAVLELLGRRMDALGLGKLVERKVVQADSPGLEPGAYDAILLAEVDHYFTDEVAWLKAATKALKPGGRIVISNRIHHRPKSMAAAQRAGLKLIADSTPVATHFIAVFVAPTSPAGAAATGAK